MKTLVQSLKATISFAFVFLAFYSISYASTFTAKASGNWSDTATWKGNTAPSYTNTSDEIVIPSGITVNMDNNVMVNGALASLEVEGTLSNSESYTLTDAVGTISGSGAISVNTVVLESGTVLLFTGTITTDYMSNSVLSLKALAKITVNKGMTLSSGLLSFDTNGSLNLSSGGTITMGGGQLANSGGTLDLSSSYNVTYTKAYSATGVEITGSGLHNVTINSGSGSVVMANDLTVAGTIFLQSGTLDLGGKNLTIKGDIAANGSGRISSNSSSNISINTATSTSGAISFMNNAKTVNNFTVNIADGGWATLASSMTVNGTLYLSKGTLYISNDTLQIAAAGSISGSSSSNYIVTNSMGYLSMYVTASATTAMYYPVGTKTQYHPANFWLNTGSNSGWVYANVSDNVYEHGTTGSTLSNNQSIVNASWDIESNVSANLNLKMELMWNSSAEVNGFDRTNAYISHYTSGNWDVTATASATAESNGMYGMTRDNIKSLSPFAVFDKNTNAAIKTDNTVANTWFSVYPNPAANLLYIHNAGTGQQLYAEIMNISGKDMGIYQLSGNNPQINVASFPSGLYFVKLYNNNTSAIAKFVKY